MTAIIILTIIDVILLSIWVTTLFIINKKRKETIRIKKLISLILFRNGIPSIVLLILGVVLEFIFAPIAVLIMAVLLLANNILILVKGKKFKEGLLDNENKKQN